MAAVVDKTIKSAMIKIKRIAPLSTLAVFGGAVVAAGLFFSEWKVVTRNLPVYNIKYESTSDEEENDDLDEITRCTQLQGQTLQLQSQTQGQTLPTEDYAILTTIILENVMRLQKNLA